MNEKFYLSEASKVLLGALYRHDGQEIPSTQCEFDISKFIRLSTESIPDLEGTTAFENVCSTHTSEECFYITNAAHQWVRTVFGHKDLQSETMANTSVSASIIESNSLLHFPYWSKLPGDEANTRPHFPSGMLQEAFKDRKSLKAKLQEWMDSGESCNIGMHKREPQSTSETCCEWEIQYVNEDDDVKFERCIAEPQDIWQVDWRGGKFACKKGPYPNEFEFMSSVSCHPNVVCGVGKLPEETEVPEDQLSDFPEEPKVLAFFMEYMSYDLRGFINERKRLDPSPPPFSSYETLDILSQIAKAMKHIHQQGHMVHCDLKSENILLSEIALSDNTKHYIVKVADFGSARCSRDSSFGPEGFIPGGITDSYAAPEALKQRKQLDMKTPGSFDLISYPAKIDVYSFGIIAFEVLTGDTNYMPWYFPSLDIKKIRESREKVIQGELKPPLREFCKRNGSIQDDDLLSLIESCWRDPVERLSFEDICNHLNKAKVRILGGEMHCRPPATQANSVKMRPSSLPMVTVEETCDVDQQAPGARRPHRRRHKRRFKWPCVS